MPLFQIYGMSTNGGEDKIGLNNLIKLYKWQPCLHAGSNTTGFPFHMPNTPQLTSAQVNVVEEGSAGVFPRRELLKAHGKFDLHVLIIN